MPYIETERLKLITFTREMMEAILKDHFGALPYQPASEWPMKVYLDLFPYKINRFIQNPDEVEWEGLIIHKEDKLIIGDMGFKGGPNSVSAIDIGYSIVPSYQGSGYATEMGKAMVKWGLRQKNVKKIVATSHPNNIASKRVLEKIGLRIVNSSDKQLQWSI